MKKIIFIAIITLAFVLGYLFHSDDWIAKSYDRYTKTVVYSEPFGKEYHLKNCAEPSCELGQIVETTVWRAKLKKLKPCKECNPK